MPLARRSRRPWTPWLPTLRVRRSDFGVIFGERAARLQEIGDDARIDDLHAHDMRRSGERRVARFAVADMRVVGEIAGSAGEDLRRARRDRLFDVDDERQFVPGDGDGLGGVARLKGRFGDDHRDDVADMRGFVGGHHGIGLQRRQGLVGIADRRQACEPAERGEVRGDVNAAHARHGARGLDVLDRKSRVRVRAAQENRVQRVLARHVGRVGPPAADEADVLDALDALAHAELHRSHRCDFPWTPAARNRPRTDPHTTPWTSAAPPVGWNPATIFARSASHLVNGPLIPRAENRATLALYSGCLHERARRSEPRAFARSRSWTRNGRRRAEPAASRNDAAEKPAGAAEPLAAAPTLAGSGSETRRPSSRRDSISFPTPRPRAPRPPAARRPPLRWASGLAAGLALIAAVTGGRALRSRQAVEPAGGQGRGKPRPRADGQDPEGSDRRRRGRAGARRAADLRKVAAEMKTQKRRRARSRRRPRATDGAGRSRRPRPERAPRQAGRSHRPRNGRPHRRSGGATRQAREEAARRRRGRPDAPDAIAQAGRARAETRSGRLRRNDRLDRTAASAAARLLARRRSGRLRARRRPGRPAASGARRFPARRRPGAANRAPRPRLGRS